MQQKPDVDDLQQHFRSKDGREGVVEMLQDAVAEGVFVDGVLGGQRDRRQTNDDDDEAIERFGVDDAMHEQPEAVGGGEEEEGRVREDRREGNGGGRGGGGGVDFRLFDAFCRNEKKNTFSCLTWFLDASSHLYKRVCPSVRRSVCRSVRRSVRPSVGLSVGHTRVDGKNRTK